MTDMQANEAEELEEGEARVVPGGTLWFLQGWNNWMYYEIIKDSLWLLCRKWDENEAAWSVPRGCANQEPATGGCASQTGQSWSFSVELEFITVCLHLSYYNRLWNKPRNLPMPGLTTIFWWRLWDWKKLTWVCPTKPATKLPLLNASEHLLNTLNKIRLIYKYPASVDCEEFMNPN